MLRLYPAVDPHHTIVERLQFGEPAPRRHFLDAVFQPDKRRGLTRLVVFPEHVVQTQVPRLGAQNVLRT